MKTLNNELRKLIDGCILGHEKSWRKFFDQYGRLIDGTVKHILGKGECEDVIQVVFLELVKNDYSLLKKFQGNSERAFFVFIKEVAKNVAKSELSKLLKKNAPIVLDGQDIDFALDKKSHLDWNESQKIEEMYSLIEILEPNYKELLYYLLMGYKYEEIAEMMEVPLNTALSWGKRAKDQLKKFNKISDLAINSKL